MNRILHIGISVADLDRTVAWYGRMFGFKEEKRFEKAELEITGAVISLDGQTIEVLAPCAPQSPLCERSGVPQALRTTGTNHIAIGVDDVAAFHQKCRSEGVVMVGELIGGKMFFCTDPDGTLLEIRAS